MMQGTGVRVNVLRVDMRSAESWWMPEEAVLYQGDRQANVIRFELMNGRSAVDAAAYEALLTVKRPDGALVACEGVLGESGLEVRLPAGCYEVAGRLGGVLRLTDSAGIHTAVSFGMTVRAPADAQAGALVTSELISIQELRALKAELEALQRTGLAVQGVAESAQALSGKTGELGQAYLVGDTLYVWTGVAWTPGPCLSAKDGASAYELACGAGFEGTAEQWLASLNGGHGRDGLDGLDGRDGTSFSVETVFEALLTDDKTVPGAINEVYGLLLGVGDVLAEINGGVEGEGA